LLQLGNGPNVRSPNKGTLHHFVPQRTVDIDLNFIWACGSQGGAMSFGRYGPRETSRDDFFRLRLRMRKQSGVLLLVSIFIYALGGLTTGPHFNRTQLFSNFVCKA
jgi:hypothetical protein